MHRVLVVGGTTAVPDWHATLTASCDVASVRDVAALPQRDGVFDAAFIDAAAVDALLVAQQLHALDPALQLALVVAPDMRPEVERAMILRRGTGELWLAPPDEVDAAFVDRAARVTRQRRAFRTTYRRIEHDLAAIEPHSARRAFISDAYLAALLGVLPDPVISADADARVTTWNSAAERFFGRPRGSALGQSLLEIVVPVQRGELHQLLNGAADGAPARGELSFDIDGQRRVTEAVVTDVSAAGRQVSMLVLHDVTEQRRVQTELEGTATELEAQSEELQHQSAMLQEAQAELEIANEELQRANASLTQRTLEAERAREEAERANRAKSDFLATMSHEIRTPINAIIGYNELLRMELAGPLEPAQRQHLERIHASSQHLLSLIEDVLDLAKIEARRVEVESDRALAVNAVAAAVEIVATQAESSGVRLASIPRGEADDAFYYGDERRVQQILVNLLTNAIKFTESGGHVEVSYGVAPDSPLQGAAATYIRVADTGIGIAPDDLRRIFRPFEQVQQGHTRTRGGAGLGLAISRELALLMGGDIAVESRVGSGSAFTLWLPRTPPDTDTQAPALGLDLEPWPPGVAGAGRALLRSLDDITTEISRRLRDALPSARTLSDAVLQDHLSAFVADLAQTLIDTGAPAAATLLIRDGSEIQHAVADLHGRQRARFGWTADALSREMELLFEILKDVIERDCSQCDPADLESALRIVRSLVSTAEQVSLRRLRPQA